MVRHHVSQRTGGVVETAAVADADLLVDRICMWSMWLRFQIGSNMPLAKRSTRMFCNRPSLPR